MSWQAVSRGFPGIVMLMILVGSISGVHAQALSKVLTVTTAGSTLILEGNLARARNMAIANGKRNAMEVAVMELIPERAVFANYEVINQYIYQRSERFIDTYRILSERSVENIYEVTLESTVVVEKLRKTLVTLGLIEEGWRIEESRFRLEISGVSCSPCFAAVKEYIENEMEGVEEVSLYAISPGIFTLDVLFKGDIESFEYTLLSRDFEDFRLDPQGRDEEDLRVLMVLSGSEDS